jgi:hypothetical protein
MRRVLLALVVVALTLFDTVWIVPSNVHFLYVVSSILALAQLFDRRLTRWCLGVFILTIALDMIFPGWAKP